MPARLQQLSNPTIYCGLIYPVEPQQIIVKDSRNRNYYSYV